jgi:hypothetical protein
MAVQRDNEMNIDLVDVDKYLTRCHQSVLV